ncbi:hypothetical protein ACK3ZN_19325, partial [Aeromonas caviae]
GVFGDSQFTSTLSVNFHFPKIPRRTSFYPLFEWPSPADPPHPPESANKKSGRLLCRFLLAWRDYLSISSRLLFSM